VETANQFHIFGWVRNTHKREVEIMAEGERTELDQFMNQIRRGPGAAFVQNLRIEWLTASDEFSRFSVIPTY
jgi:acylphosphatase